MSNMINIVIFGPPGAGKGTQSVRLAEKYQLVHISTGDLFRAHKAEGTELGKLAQSYADKGDLVPDEVTIAMLREKVNETPDGKGFIFDGFPRTTAQATALDTLLSELGTSVTACLSMHVPDQELIGRLMERGKTSGRSDDSDPNIIQNRLDVYQRETAPLKGFYQEQGKLLEVDGVGSIDTIFDRLCEALEQQARQV